jgi:hypothetical protein
VAGARLNRRWHLTSYFCELLPAERLALCKRSDVRGGSIASFWPGLATSGLLPVPDISLRRAKCRDVTVSDSHTAASRIGPVSGEGLARPEAMAFRLATDSQ